MREIAEDTIRTLSLQIGKIIPIRSAEMPDLTVEVLSVSSEGIFALVISPPKHAGKRVTFPVLACRETSEPVQPGQETFRMFDGTKPAGSTTH